MIHGFCESEDGLHYAEHISWPMRLFVAVIGLAMFLIPLPFLQHGHWGLPWWQLLLLAFCITLPVLLGMFFLCLACGRCLRLHFDQRQRCLVRHGRLPLPARAIRYADIEPPSLLERSSEDGPYYVLRLRVRGERAMHLSSFGLQTEAQVWRQRLANELQQP